MNIQFNDKWALVTGAGAGIGLGCARVLAKAGANVAVNDIDNATAEKTAQEIREMGRKSIALPGDVGSMTAVDAIFAKLARVTNELHILINNAGFNLFKGLADTSQLEWDRIMRVDLGGVFLMSRAALPMLKNARIASIVNIASVHAQATVANITAYAAAKGGVVAMTRSMCQELGPMGIRVNAISPGFTQTPLIDRWVNSTEDPDATRKRVDGLHPLGRIATPEEIGHLAAFLSSPYAAFITGQNISVDGGLTSRIMH